MGRNSCSPKQKLRKGLWSPEEDEKLYNYITRYGVGCWSSVPKLAGLQRCGKSCRLRWINYLRPDLKRGMFSQEEEDLIISLHEALGNRWAQIAAQLPGRTDNEIKNFWNSSLKKKLMKQGIDPNTHKPINETHVTVEDKILQPEGVLNSATSSSTMEQQAAYQYSGKQVYDPLFLSEFQANVDLDGFGSNFLSHCQQNPVRPYEHNQIESDQINVNPIGGFNSMPNLTNFDHQSYYDYSDSRMSKCVMNEAKDRNFQQGMINNVVENGGAFSWDVENKMDPVFQFQFSGIQIDERKLHTQSSEDFSNYELTGPDLHTFHNSM